MKTQLLPVTAMLPRISICRAYDTRAREHRRRVRISEFYELCYYTEGGGSVFINGEEYVIGAGDVRFTPPGTELHGKPHYKSYSVYFDFGEPSVIYENPILQGIPVYFHGGAEPLGRFKKMLDLFLSAEVTAPARLNAALLSLLSALYDGLRTLEALSPPVRACKHYIEQHFSEKITLDQLCALSGYSKPHLLRMFGRELCYSPHDYLTAVRIKHAKHLLTESDLTLSVIASECGFDSDSHFKYLFKTRTGITPGSYRSNADAEPETS